MKKLKVSDITTGIGMPIKSGTLEHIQAAYQEALTAVARLGLTSYDGSSTVYILWGCDNTGSGSTYTISEGAVYYNGEIYLVPAASFTASGSNVAVGNVVTSYYTGTQADPVTFTDSTARYVHEIRRMVITAGASGSGVADFTNWVDFKHHAVDKAASLVEINGHFNSMTTATLAYKRIGNLIFMNYYIAANISSYNSTLLEWTIDLPVAAVVDDEYQSPGAPSSCDVHNVAQNHMLAYITAAAPSKLRFKATGTQTGVVTMRGQIIYKAA